MSSVTIYTPRVPSTEADAGARLYAAFLAGTITAHPAGLRGGSRRVQRLSRGVRVPAPPCLA